MNILSGTCKCSIVSKYLKCGLTSFTNKVNWIKNFEMFCVYSFMNLISLTYTNKSSRTLALEALA